MKYLCWEIHFSFEKNCFSFRKIHFSFPQIKNYILKKIETNGFPPSGAVALSALKSFFDTRVPSIFENGTDGAQNRN